MAAPAVAELVPKGIHEHVCGFHFYTHDMSRQVEAHHYCAHPTEELWQCVLYGELLLRDSCTARRGLCACSPAGLAFDLANSPAGGADSDEPGARLIGVEYIVSERLFQALPEAERRLWHSHRYEVQSGVLVAPHVPKAAERADMQKLAGTYGKAVHTWQIDRGDALPLGGRMQGKGCGLIP